MFKASFAKKHLCRTMKDRPGHSHDTGPKLRLVGGRQLPSIRVIRDSGYADHFRSYRIEVDGKKIADIRNGETRLLSVSPGMHHLAVRISWCGSQTLAFTVSEDDTATFRASSALRGWRLFLGLWYVCFAWGSYIRLEPDTVTSGDAFPESRGSVA
jgi:hypothetical protein